MYPSPLPGTVGTTRVNCHQNLFCPDTVKICNHLPELLSAMPHITRHSLQTNYSTLPNYTGADPGVGKGRGTRSQVVSEPDSNSMLHF